LLKQHYERTDSILEAINDDYEGRFAYAARLAAQFSKRRGFVQEVLDTWLDYWRDLLLIKAGYPEALTNVNLEDTLLNLTRDFSLAEIRAFIGGIRAAQEQLRQNANPRLVLEVLMLDMPRRKGEAVTG
jgi:DNA polymerase-3 subunit delta'